MREKLIELIRDGRYKAEAICNKNNDCQTCTISDPDGYCKYGCIADHLIANGVTFAEDNNVPGKWISVKDRLPEVAITHNNRWEKSTESVHVLCYCKQRSGKRMVKEGSCKVYSNGTIYWAIPGTIDWMPMPQPPKGE